SSGKVASRNRMITPHDALRADLNCPSRARKHQEVTEFGRVILSGIHILSATAVERVEYVDCRGYRMWRLAAGVMAVLEADFMNQLRVDNRTLTHLKFRIVGGSIGRALEKRETTVLAESLVPVFLFLIIKIRVQRVVLVDRELRPRIHAPIVIRRHKWIVVL